MVARKKVHYLDSVVSDDLRDRILRVAVQAREGEREALRKDFLLIEAALATDRTVISLDDRVRKLFAVAARSVGELRKVVWVNPEQTEEQAVLWLENGAKPEMRYLLGFRAGGSQ
ncbi:MAG: hypothetical protein HYZ72_08145 [Deltaproteobacteria bacterium]|nr:hypothetical protein [Deltaproteobacteria bacterium]